MTSTTTTSLTAATTTILCIIPNNALDHNFNLITNHLLIDDSHQYRQEQQELLPTFSFADIVTLLL
jgi:hypothetical protein